MARRILVIGLLWLLGSFAGARAEAPLWTIDHANSAITFKAVQMDAVFEGRFNQWRASIRFDANALSESTTCVEVELSSIDTGYDARDAQVQDNEWFDSAHHPTATFHVTRFRHLEGNDYAADAELTLRGHTEPVTLPFTLEIATDQAGQAHASMSGSLTLDRTAFGVGQGEWAASDSVGKEVIVSVRVAAHR